MPTENRSSNTEMVSDSEMTECQFHNNCGGWCETRRELEHNLCEHCLEAHDEEMASPAKQHKVEPVAWLYSRPEGQVEPVVLLERASESDRGSWDETPLYTRADPADPGEVEQLHKGHIKSLEALNEQTQKQRDHWMAECKKRDAQLAERDALLREAHDLINSGYLGSHDSRTRRLAGNLRERIKAALSASAEPSSTTWSCGPCKVEMADKRPCDLCGAEPSAPVERDERAEFETWAKEHGLPVTRTPTALMFHGGQRREAGDYIAVETLCADAAWQARAALERKPS